MTDHRLLWPLTGCTLLAVVLAVELTTGTRGGTASDAPPKVSAPAAVVDAQHPAPLGEFLATAAARPLFSPTRRPPEGAAAASGAFDKRLAGIVIEADRRLAIFANPDKPLVLSEGESVDGWRIEAITSRQVVVRGPAGAETLQPKIDPNLVPPPRPQPAQNIAASPPARPPAAAAAVAVPQPRPTRAIAPVAPRTPILRQRE